jgi:hypothetical protein
MIMGRSDVDAEIKKMKDLRTAKGMALSLQSDEELARLKLIELTGGETVHQTNALVQGSDEMQETLKELSFIGAAAAVTPTPATATNLADRYPRASVYQPPSQWVAQTDAGSGKVYYFNRKTKLTTWTKPADFKPSL